MGGGHRDTGTHLDDPLEGNLRAGLAELLANGGEARVRDEGAVAERRIGLGDNAVLLVIRDHAGRVGALHA